MEHNNVEEYEGYEIRCDIGQINGTRYWQGAAVIVSPPDASAGIPAVKAVPGIPVLFDSEEEARESLLRIAREVIDAAKVGRATKAERWKA